MAQRGADARGEFADPEGFFDIIISTKVKRRDLLALAVAGREDDDRDVRPASEAGDYLLAIHIRQAEIEDDEIRRLGGYGLQRFRARAGFDDLIARSRQRGFQKTLDLRLVIDDQDARLVHVISPLASLPENRMTIRVPRFFSAGLSAWILPPMASTKPRAMDRPSPVPGARPSGFPLR